LFIKYIIIICDCFFNSVLGVIVVCLFPLWPESVREYSWYLSVAGAVFVGAILVLAICKCLPIKTKCQNYFFLKSLRSTASLIG